MFALPLLALVACAPGEDETPDLASDPSAATQTPAADPATAADDPLENREVLRAEGWGPLRIGMSLEEITDALGPDANPAAVGGPDPESCDQFRPERAPEGLLVMVESGRLTRLSVGGDASLKTDRGFGLGDPASEIKAAYGDDASVTPHKYQDAPAEYITVWDGGPRGDAYVQDEDARGIVYEIGSDGNVLAIHAGGPSIQYVEGCA